jgi:hypothetical protein
LGGHHVLCDRKRVSAREHVHHEQYRLFTILSHVVVGLVSGSDPTGHRVYLALTPARRTVACSCALYCTYSATEILLTACSERCRLCHLPTLPVNRRDGNRFPNSGDHCGTVAYANQSYNTCGPNGDSTTSPDEYANTSLSSYRNNPWDYTFTNTGKPLFKPNTAICNYLACIPSFWTSTNSYVDECADGMFSHSGGVQGACSHHGGEATVVYEP